MLHTWRCPVKLWRRKDEWVQYASCGGDERFTAEFLNTRDVLEVLDICAGCQVRVECMKWCLDNKASSVVVAGVRLPDPSQKKTLRMIYKHFREAIPREVKARGNDV